MTRRGEDVDRRRFVSEGAAVGLIALGGAGTLLYRRSQAREALTSHMLKEALPSLDASAAKGLNALPVRAREEIKRYFHGKCLNVEGFVTHICSNQFAERLGRCRTPADREACFLHAFCSRVASEAEILNQVETIADDIGSELDSAWSSYCGECGPAGTRASRVMAPGVAADELQSRLDGMIRTELEQAARLAMAGNQRPAVGETIGKIGASAVMLLPLVPVAPLGLQVGIPLFVMLAAKHVWDYAMGRLEDRRAGYQAAISGRLALLGNRVGAEFEREVRLRITDLHAWQDRSVPRRPVGWPRSGSASFEE